MSVLPERKANPYKRLCGLCNKTKRVILMPEEDPDEPGTRVYPGFKIYVCDTCD